MKVISLQFEIDEANNVAYLYLARGRVDRTIVVENFHLDMDEHGRLVGIEFMNVALCPDFGEP